MSDPDLRLAGRASSGDRRALALLYDRHKGRLLGYLVRIVGRRDVAEDVFQEVWVKVVQGIDRFRPEPGTSFRAWLFRIAGNAAVDRLRYEHRRGGALRTALRDGEDPLDVDRYPSSLPGPERVAGGRLATDVLGDKLRRLPEKQRAAVLLRHQQGMSYPEVAAALAVPQGTAKTLVHRGVLRLRKAMQAFAPDRPDDRSTGQGSTEWSDD